MKKWLLIIIVAVIVLGAGAYWFYSISTSRNISDLNSGNSSTTPALNGNSSSSIPANIIFTTSTTQIGTYTLVTYCSKNIIDHAEIMNGASVVQTVSSFGGEPAPNGSCAEPQSQDVNFDGNPDIMVLNNTGATGNQVYQYLLFNTSTKQFYCPGGSYGCLLVNPGFEASNKTIVSNANLGCAGMCYDHQIYNIVNGVPSLYQETTVSSGAGGYIKTIKQSVNGQMTVISTSTVNPQDEWRACLAAGTKVLMADGSYKEIENVNVGDAVVSFDEKTKTKTTAVVSNVIQREDPLVTINGSLRAAPDEIIYLSNEEAKSAIAIKLGDRLIGESGDSVLVTSVSDSSDVVKTYDLTLNGANTFFADGYLVRAFDPTNSIR